MFKYAISAILGVFLLCGIAKSQCYSGQCSVSTRSYSVPTTRFNNTRQYYPRTYVYRVPRRSYYYTPRRSYSYYVPRYRVFLGTRSGMVYCGRNYCVTLR